MERESIKELFSKAQSFRAGGDPRKALAILREIVRREPSNAEALSNTGLLLYEMNDFDGAIDSYQESLKIKPLLVEVHCNLGTAYLGKGALAPAEQAFTAALGLKKDFIVALLGLGAVRQAAGDLEGAKKQYVEALRLQPGDASAHFHLGVIMREWDRLDMAAGCFRNAIRFKPDNGPAYMGLGETLQAAGQIDESEVCFRKAVELEPVNNFAYSNMLISMNYNPLYSSRQIYEEHKKWGDDLVIRTTGTTETRFSIKKELDRILRVGYLSSDFCKHPAASFLEPLLRNHDPSGFQVYCYSQGKVRDEKTVRFKLLADKWQEIRLLGDDQARRLIQNDKIDILVDCTGHMADNRLPLMAGRCAPVQVSWIGYPNTTGLSSIDYRFGDEVTDPITDEVLYVEKLVRLPDCFCCFEPPEDAPDLSELPALRNGHITFGSLHTLARLNSKVIVLWSKVLSRIPSARLCVFRTVLNDEIVKRLSVQFARNKIDPRRIDFVKDLPEGGHLAMYDRIDIALDTFPWSGHTTACEALWMGAPVITFAGERHAGRMVASVLTQLGLEDFIAESEGEYVEIAGRIASEIPSLSMLRKGLRELMEGSRLCDGRTFARHVEHEYRKMWMKI
jgi:protein O-GlcNAc transferase